MQIDAANDELLRLRALREAGSSAFTGPNRFEPLARMAARLCNAPSAIIAVIEENMLRIKAAVGVDASATAALVSICIEVAQRQEVVDAGQAAWNHCLSGLPCGVRFWAGMPVLSDRGAALGSVCVFGYEPRSLTQAELVALQDVANLTRTEVELREKSSCLEAEFVARKRLQSALEKAKAESRARMGELQESRQQLYAMLDHAPAAIYLKDLDGRHLMVNRLFSTLLGKGQPEIVGRTVEELFPPDIAAQLRTNDQTVKLSDSAQEFAERVPVNGEIRVYRSLKFPVRNGDGKVCGICGISSEMTPLQTAPEEWRQADVRRAAILDAALDGIITFDQEGHVLELNPAAARIFGHPPGEMIGKALLERIVPARMRASHRQGLQRLLSTTDNQLLGRIFETPAMRADGSEFPIELAVIRIPVEGPAIFTAHIRDISERKRAELAVEESRARFERMAANLPGMVFQITQEADRQSRFTYVSPGCAELLGYLPQDLLKDVANWHEAIHPTERATFHASFEKSAITLEPWAWEGRIVHTTGKTRWVRGIAHPMRGRDGAIVWDGFVFDLTDRRLAEQALVHSRDEAQRANRSKNEFLSRMSHELRTPLNAILGFGQLLERAKLKPRDADSAGQITKAGRHLLNLINEVLNLASIEAGRMTLSPELLDATELLHEALTLLAPLAATRDIRVNSLVTRSCWVSADRQRLSQVLLNVLSNALKYNRPSGVVTIEASEDSSSYLNIAIRDTGLGISKDRLARVFLPFERLGAEGSDVEGSGIGLALSKRLMEMMGGTITVQSTEGSGTTFTVRIPVAEAPAHPHSSPAAPIEPSASEATGSDKHTVVYVEDNPANVALMMRIMEQRGDIDLKICERGDTAMMVITRSRPSVVLLDLHLPGLDGEHILRELRSGEATRDVPVVIISADAMPAQIRRLMAAGATNYLTKPIQVGEILRLLSELLDFPQRLKK